MSHHKGWTERLDLLCREVVRARKQCQDPRPDHACAGYLQWAHGFSRRYRNTRWDPRFHWLLCMRSHAYWECHPLEWQEFMRSNLGDELYAEGRALAMSNAKVDHEAVYEKLKREAEALGIAAP